MTAECKLCLEDIQDIKNYLYSISVKFTTNYQKKTVRANGNIYHIFEPKIFRDVQNLYQFKASMDMTLNEFKCSTNICWNQKYQPLTIDKN